jgi:carboxylesterase
MTAVEHPLEPPVYSGFEPIPADQKARLMKDALPQFFPARGRAPSDAIVVCFHGFTGMAYEAEPVAEACAQAGLNAVTVLLPGHGYAQRQDQRQQFARITGSGLLASARQVLDQARQRYPRVGVFGQSMGGAIALQMAAEQRVDSCAVAAPALRLPTQGEILIPLLSWAGFTLPSNIQHDFYLPCYDFYHSYALRALWQVSRRARRSLRQITCPVYAAHSHHDTTIPPLVMDWLQRDIPHLQAVDWLDHSNHVLTRDVDGEVLCQQVAAFMANTL